MVINPFRSYHFLLEIDGINRGGFRECSGLDATQDPIEYREGNDALTARKLPGLNTYSNIVLKWGTVDDDELWQWRLKAIEGNVERKNGSIVQLDEKGSEAMRWNFREGWACKWEGPTYDATGNEVSVETLEIAHEGLEKAPA